MRANSLEPWDEVVGALYDAVLLKEPDALGQAIVRFERLVGSDGCHLFGVDAHGQELFTVWTFPGDLDAVTAPYYVHYMHIDPRLEMLTRSVGKAVRTSDHFNSREVSHSEFFQDYLFPVGIRFSSGGTLLQSERCTSAIAFNRLHGRPDFSDEELAHVHRYFPHLQRALRMALSDAVGTLQQASQADLLRQQWVGVIGLDRHQRIQFINPLAQGWLARLAHLGLHGSGVRDASPLALACAQARCNRQPQGMRLQTPEGELILTVWATPLRSATTWLPSVSAASDQALHTCITLQLLRPGHRLTPSLLMGLYGFSAAEARLAKELVQGSTVEDCAQKFHISVATVRTQLRQVLAKSGYARQQDLIAHLAALQVP